MAIVASGNVIADAFVRIRPDATGFDGALRQTIASNLLQLEKQSGSILDKFTGSLKTTAKVLATTGATSFALYSTAALKTAADVEKISNSFKGLFGGIEAGRKQFDRVFQLAEETPFEGSQLAKDFQKFTAAYTSSGLSIEASADKSLEILETLADGGAVLGATTPKLAGFSLALTQMVGKGKLTGEEIRQMTNNLDGFNIRGAVATEMFGNSLPESIAKLDKEMRKGAVSSDVAMEGILKGLRRLPGAAGASERQLRTVSGSLSTIKDVFQRSTFLGLESSLKVFSNTLVDNSNRFREIFKTNAEELGNMLVIGTSVFSEILADFDNTIGKISSGGMKAASELVFGLKDSALSVTKDLGRMGEMLLRNEGQAIIFGKSIGNLISGFFTFFTDIALGFENIGIVANDFFSYFSKGSKYAFELFGGQIKSALTTVGGELAVAYVKIKESFLEAFDPQVAIEFLKALTGVVRSIIEVVVSPIQEIGEKSQSLATGLESILRKVTPAIKQVDGAFSNLGLSLGKVFANLDVDNMADFFGTVAVEVVRSYETLLNFGRIAVDVFATVLKVLGPVSQMFGDLPEKIVAAFVVFKLTNSPLLTMISLFRDMDTGMIAFFLTLSKVVPLIRQMQAAMASLGATNFLGNIAKMASPVYGPQMANVMPASAFAAQAGLGVRKTANLQKMLQREQLADLNIFDKATQQSVFNQMNSQKNLRTGYVQTKESLNSLTNSMKHNITFSERIAAINQRLGIIHTNTAQAVMKGRNAWDIATTSVNNNTKQTNAAAQAQLPLSSNIIKTNTNLGKTVSQSSAAGSSLATAGTKATMVGSALSSVGGIAASLGLGVGISLFTAHLAKSAEQANRTKQAIDEMKRSFLDVLTAQPGTEQNAYIAQLANDLPGKFEGDSLDTFNKALAESGLTYNKFVKDLSIGSRDSRISNATSLVENILNQEKGKAFEKPGAFGTTSFVNKDQDQQLRNFLVKSVEVGTFDELGTGFNANTKAFWKTVGKTTDTEIGSLNDFLSLKLDERNQIIKDADLEGIVSNQGLILNDGLRVRKSLQETLKPLQEVMKGYSSAAEGAQAYAKAMGNVQEQAKIATGSFKSYAESQRVALSATNAFYDKMFEFNTKENLEKMSKDFQAVQKMSGGLLSPDLFQTEAGRGIATPFASIVQSEIEIMSNINAPMAQQVKLLKETNEQYVALADNVGINGTALKELDSVVGNLGFAEDLGMYINGITEAGEELKETDISAIISEAMNFDETQRESFISSIVDDDVRKRIETALDGIKVTAELGFNVESYTAALIALETEATSLREKGLTLDVEFVFGNSFQAERIRSQIDATFKETSNATDNLITKLDNAEISMAEFLEKNTQAWDKSRESMEAMGIATDIIDKSIQSFWLNNDGQELKDFKVGISVLPDEQQKTIIEDFLNDIEKDFGKRELYWDARLELDPVEAQKEFDKVLKSIKPDDGIAQFSTYSAKAIAAFTKEMDAEKFVAEIVPELGPGFDWDTFITNNTDRFITLIPHLDSQQLNIAMATLTASQTIDFIGQIPPENEEALKSALAGIATHKYVDIIPNWSQEELDRYLHLIPEEKLLNIIPQLSDAETANVLSTLSATNPEMYVSLITKLDPISVSNAFELIPKNTLVSMLTKMDDKSLRTTLSLMPDKHIAKVLPSLDEETKKKVQGVLDSMTGRARISLGVPGLTVRMASDGKSASVVTERGVTRWYANGGIIDRASVVGVGEAGSEAIIPLVPGRSNRAMSLMKESGLYNRVLQDSSSTNNDQSIHQEINIDMRDTRTTDPEGLALMIGSQLVGGIRR